MKITSQGLRKALPAALRSRRNGRALFGMVLLSNLHLRCYLLHVGQPRRASTSTLLDEPIRDGKYQKRAHAYSAVDEQVALRCKRLRQRCSPEWG